MKSAKSLSHSKESNRVEDWLWSQRLSSTASQLIVALMMALLMVPVVLVGQRIFQGWDGSYLIGISLVISLEAMFARRRLHGRHFPEPGWLIFRITEWVVILVALKFLMYGLRGSDQIWNDLISWRQDFLHNFFSDEYLFTCLVALVIWALSSEVGELLELLEGDEQLLKQEEDVEDLLQRSLVRERLANIFIFLGAIMVVMTALLRLESGRGWNQTPLARSSAYAVLAYFLLGLVLLSLTQFSILRVRWLINRLPVQRRVASRWLVSSFLLIGCLVVIASLLPTAYSVGLLSLLGIVLGYLMKLALVILTLLAMPFILLAGWILSLFDVKMKPVEMPEVQPPPLPEYVAGSGAPWLELLKSIVFWGVLVGLIVYSFVYYLREHREYIERLARLPMLGWIVRVMRALASWARNMGGGAAGKVSAGWRNMRRRPAIQVLESPGRFINPRRLSPREQVYFYYLAMIRRGRQAGLPRGLDQTPYEYARRLEEGLLGTVDQEKRSDQVPVSSEGRGIKPDAELTAGLRLEIDAITGEFVEARYSRHAITSEHAGLARRYWERIRQVLRRKKLKTNNGKYKNE